MATVITNDEHYKNIANAIREKTGIEDGIYPPDMATEIPKVYEAGVKSEYDRFWDSFQDYGNRTGHVFAFAGYGWTDETFKPKYTPIVSGGFYQTFACCKIRNLNADLLVVAGGTCRHMFSCSSANVPKGQGITNITGTLDLTKATDMDGLFAYCFSMVNVECIKLPKTSVEVGSAFYRCEELVEIRFDTSDGGYIRRNFSFAESKKLSHDSLMSIINALYNYAGSGTTYTLTIGTTNLAKLTNAEKAIATEKGWTLA